MSELVTEVDRLAKRQQTCETTTRDALAWTLQRVQDALLRVRTAGGDNTPDMLHELASNVRKAKLSKQVASATLEYHDSVKTVSKIVDGNFVPDICAAARAETLPEAPMNKAIIEHLYWEGLFEAGDRLAEECGIADCVKAKQLFMDMHAIMKQINCGELDAALQWALKHRSELSKSNQATRFEFKMHRLRFLKILQAEGGMAALQYARCHFDQFQDVYMDDIRPLMGCLVYAFKPLAESPYKRLVAPNMYAEVVQDFVREACSVVGQACESPLLVAAAAGAVALPQLLKLVKVMSMPSSSTMVDLATCEHMPLELELGPEFNFHSIFACPVSREQTDHGNPPKMLPCGHVLCEHTIANIAKKHQSSFKCPYCPIETHVSQCRQLNFPDVQ